MAAVDILYIDITRRWNSVALDQRDTGTRRHGEGSVHLLSSVFHSFTLRRGGEKGMEWNVNHEALSATKARQPLPKLQSHP